MYSKYFVFHNIFNSIIHFPSFIVMPFNECSSFIFLAADCLMVILFIFFLFHSVFLNVPLSF